MQRIGLLVGQPMTWEPVRAALARAGYQTVVAAPDPAPLDSLLDEADPDVVLVELGPALYPLHLVRTRLRGRPATKPLLIVALARPEHLQPAHFVVGVDEFVLPPYDPDEILARLQLVLWRAKRIDAQHVVCSDELTVDLAHRDVRRDGHPIALSGREYDLLTFLVGHRGRAFSREALLRHVWGYEYEGDNRVVDQYIRRLRSKLGDPDGSTIQTVRGLGYRLNATTTSGSATVAEGRPAAGRR